MGGEAELYGFPGTPQACIEMGGEAFMQWRDDALKNRFGEFSLDYEAASAFLNSQAERIRLDPEGRFMITPAIREHAGIGDKVVFEGRGRFFCLWSPQRYEAQAETTRQAWLKSREPVAQQDGRP